MPGGKTSWSAVDAFNKCTLQHSLHYEQRIKVPRDERIWVVGSTIHETIHGWSKSGYQSGYLDTHLHQHLTKELRRIPDLRPDEQQKFVQKAVEAAPLAFDLFSTMDFQSHEVACEYRFTVPFPNHPHWSLTGSVDIYDPVRQAIYDWKISKTTKGSRGQILTYALALRYLNLVVQSGGFLLPLQSPNIIEFAITPSDIDAQERNLLAIIARIDEQQVPVATPGSHCWSCEYNKTVHCPATYKPPIVATTQGKANFLQGE